MQWCSSSKQKNTLSRKSFTGTKQARASLALLPCIFILAEQEVACINDALHAESVMQSLSCFKHPVAHPHALQMSPNHEGQPPDSKSTTSVLDSKGAVKFSTHLAVIFHKPFLYS